MNDTTNNITTSEAASGRFVLRIDPGLHAALRQCAQEAGVSLNEFCSQKLTLPATGIAGPGAEATAKAAALVRDALVGVVVFGSWARNEMAQESDVDLLIVVDKRIQINRSLYRKWDEAPLHWDGHLIEPHFVHLPKPGAPTSGTWADVAVEGMVLYERDLIVSRMLVELRQRIVSGQIVRRRVHGQPYWTEAA